jgi:hypothetical protein
VENGLQYSGETVIETISAADENTAFVLYGIGKVCFVSVDEDMRSGPPFRGRDGKFHGHGTLEVVSGVFFDRILTLLKDVVSACKGRKLILILPMPRYWIPCCEKGRKLDSLESDSEKRNGGQIARNWLFFCDTGIFRVCVPEIFLQRWSGKLFNLQIANWVLCHCATFVI